MKHPIDVVPKKQERIHALLENWGIWCRGKWKQGECGSIEHEYSIPWRQWHRPELQATCNMPDAIEIQTLMHMLPKQHREAVNLHYYWRANPYRICRQLVVRYEDFGRWMCDCRSMVHNLLVRHSLTSAKYRVIIAANSIPPQGEEVVPQGTAFAEPA